MSLLLSNSRLNPEVLNFTEKLNQVLKANKLLQKKTKPKNYSEIKSVKPKSNKISLISSIYNNINNINNSDDKSTDLSSGDKKYNIIQEKISHEKMENYYRIEKILEKSVTKVIKPKEEKIDLNTEPNQIKDQIILEEDNSDNYDVEELDSSSIPEIDLTKNNVEYIPEPVLDSQKNKKEIKPEIIKPIINKEIRTEMGLPRINMETIVQHEVPKNVRDENELINDFFHFNKNNTNIHNINSFSDNINIINSINAIDKPRKYNKKINYNNHNHNHKANKFNIINNQTKNKVDIKTMKYNYLRKNLTKKNNLKKEIKESTPEEIEKEFYDITNEEDSTIDKLFKSMSFFIEQGFAENVRYLFFENLMNYGLPINGNFNLFYQRFKNNCAEYQITVPNGKVSEIYVQFIIDILLKTISESKKNFIANFFFDGNNYDCIRNNFNFIAFIRDLISLNEFNLYNFLMDKYDLLFNFFNMRVNLKFANYKSVISKILSNLIIKCDKEGYFNFRQYIDDDKVIFRGIKIKDNQYYNYGVYNLKKMICIKVFGIDLTNERFNDIISEFFLYLFSHFNYANIMQYK